MTLLFPPVRISTGPSGRIDLQRHSPDLASAMFAKVDQDRIRLGRFLPWVEHTRTVEDESAFIRMTLESWDKRELFDFGIFRINDSAYLGNIGVHTISWSHRRCEIGYWVVGEAEGKGYITEALQALERELFAIGFNRIEIHCSSSNIRSAAVPRRAGYRLEGMLRQDRIEAGDFCDTMIFAKLKNDARTEVVQLKTIETYGLRQRILRPGLPLEQSHFHGDDDPGSLHLGARLEGQVISVASFVQEAKPELNGKLQYRLRGMATHEAYQGFGLGARILIEGLRKLQYDLGADFIWCNARESATGFYLKQGFKIGSLLFTLPGVGPHYVMYRTIP